ncbi:hypothetical protein NE865_15264 [Phthorimaea operculella]|nr:hypothetical protein NE865_15264 [Phthorimaea operculella]
MRGDTPCCTITLHVSRAKQAQHFAFKRHVREETHRGAPSHYTPDPPLSINPTEIYHKHVGMLPNYAGHVPGHMFRFGMTYGNDTRDAKRWLRGDFLS